MKRMLKSFGKISIVAMLIASLIASPVFAASTASAVTSIRFRTAVVNQIKCVNGSAQITRGGEVMDMYEGMRLFSSDRVKTEGNTTIYILIDQDKIIRLDPNSEAVLKETFLGRRVKIKLISGSMFFNVVEKLPENESIQFVYGNITISVRGTSALMGGDNGAFRMMLLDGKVEATTTSGGTGEEGTGETKSMKIEPGTKFQYAPGTEENGGEPTMETGNFTLQELPASVVEEMKNDEKLRDRIIGSVPVSNDTSGEQYADSSSVDLNTIGQPDKQAMAPSESIAKSAGIDMTEYNKEETTQTNAAEESSSEEPAQPSGPVCPACGESVTYTEAHRMDCGHYSCQVPASKLEEHTLALCENHYRCEEGFDPELHLAKSPCGHCMYDAADDWRHHVPVKTLESGFMFMCEIEDDTEEFGCPICGSGPMTKSEFLASEHCQYDGKRDEFVCCGRDQTNDHFYNILGQTFTPEAASLLITYFLMIHSEPKTKPAVSTNEVVVKDPAEEKPEIQEKEESKEEPKEEYKEEPKEEYKEEPQKEETNNFAYKEVAETNYVTPPAEKPAEESGEESTEKPAEESGEETGKEFVEESAENEPMKMPDPMDYKDYWDWYYAYIWWLMQS